MRTSRRLLFTLLAALTMTTAVRAQDFVGGDTPAPQPNTSVFKTLTTSNVFVDPALAGRADERALLQETVGGRDNPHTYAKIAMFKQLPADYLSNVPRKVRGAERKFYAYSLHKYLNMQSNVLVLVVFNGTGQGVTVWTDGLSDEARTALARRYGAKINADPNQAGALAQAAVAEVNNKEYRGSATLWKVFFVIAGVVVVMLFSATRRKKVQLSIARQPVDALRANVLSGIEYLDGYMDVLPANNPDTDAVRTGRQAASAKFEQAVKILDRATEESDMQRAQGLLDRAQADIQTARRALDRVTGGTGNIPGDDAVRPEPLPQSEAEVQAIPENQRGVSFFSAQPAPVGALVPVTITVNGQSRQVLATPEEADELRQGRMPQVRSFDVNGRQVPWYEDNRYDPYNDYWRNQNNGWSGFFNGWMAASLLSNLTAPYTYAPYSFGYGGADMAYREGYSDAQMNNSGGGVFDGGNGNSDGGSGFFNIFGGGNSSEDQDSGVFSGSTDESGSFFGSDDFGGSGDDSGSFGGDSGGSDGGGGDSGGGGDF